MSNALAVALIERIALGLVRRLATWRSRKAKSPKAKKVWKAVGTATRIVRWK